MLLLLSAVVSLVFISPTWTATNLAVPVAHRDMDVNLLLNSPVLDGSDLDIKCLFEVPKGTAVSSVKWYKGTREIFRYEHKPVPKKQILPFGNLTIDEEGSGIQQLYLKHVPAFMSGKISCEVTLEDPSAKAITKSGNLLVAVPPTEAPALEASLVQFSHNNIIHQTLIANCTSAPSKPASNLTIFINNSPHFAIVPKIERIRSLPDILVNNNLAVRRIELELHLTSQHFVNGKIWIKCASTLFNLHQIMSDEYVLEQVVTTSKKRNLHYTGSRFRSGGNHLTDCGRIPAAIMLLILCSILQICNC